MNRTEERAVRVEGDPPVYWFESVGSTNDEALALGEGDAPHLTAVVADTP